MRCSGNDGQTAAEKSTLSRPDTRGALCCDRNRGQRLSHPQRCRPSVLVCRTPFEIVDSREPKDWISGYGSDGERYAYPPPLNEPGFFEDFFENRTKTVKTFWNVVNERLATVGRVA